MRHCQLVTWVERVWRLLIDSWCLTTRKDNNGINSFVCAVSLYIAETPKASIKGHEPPLQIKPFGIVANGSFWTTFLETALIHLQHYYCPHEKQQIKDNPTSCLLFSRRASFWKVLESWVTTNSKFGAKSFFCISVDLGNDYISFSKC